VVTEERVRVWDWRSSKKLSRGRREN
jgi:hypothetical protein